MDTKDKLTKVLAEYKSLGIAEQIDYDKFYLYSLITHSTSVSGRWTEKVDRKGDVG
jgi:hypothetical protein